MRATAVVRGDTGDCCTARWDLDGDGQFDDATGATVPRPAGGRVELKATDASGDIGVASLAVVGGDIVPTESLPAQPGDAGPLAKGAPLRVTASVGRVTLSRLLSRGLPVTVRCDVACRATATLAKRGAPRLGTASGASRLAVKVGAKARRALRKTRSLKLQVAISATTADGRNGSTSTTLTIKR